MSADHDLGLPPSFTPERLNALLWGYEHTDVLKQDEWLDAELKKTGEEHHSYRLREVFARVLGAPYVFLDQYPGGAVSSDELWAEHDAHIMEVGPWLDERNFGWAAYQSRYYAWHDGLVASK